MSNQEHELTKKNEAFVFQLGKLLGQSDKLDGDQVDDIIAEVRTKLYENQSTGRTAAQIYGTPSLAANHFLDPKQNAKTMQEYSNWTLTLDTAMAFLTFIALYVGATMLLSKNSNTGIGITFVLAMPFLIAFMYVALMRRLVPDPKNPNPKPIKRWVAWLTIPGITIFMLAISVLLVLLPHFLNPVLPGWLYIVIGVLAFVILRWNRGQAGMHNVGILAVSKLAQQSREQMQNNKD
ncbi:DUF1129 domain-containing protein [Eupransor demetentiae]|uniref:Uncharacterized membrane-anchored protein n=1 Tax=Eupransor demetentiae TaxID=3109584 RepID=A0ABM9N2V6_9LACO|nr:Uncharacterized membrane-anchored protein [Lactobacillaceae bacterium LMG 33000]